jgi:hypothetical protein
VWQLVWQLDLEQGLELLLVEEMALKLEQAMQSPQMPLCSH